MCTLYQSDFLQPIPISRFPSADPHQSISVCRFPQPIPSSPFPSADPHQLIPVCRSPSVDFRLPIPVCQSPSVDFRLPIPISRSTSAISVCRISTRPFGNADGVEGDTATYYRCRRRRLYAQQGHDTRSAVRHAPARQDIPRTSVEYGFTSNKLITTTP